MKSFWTFTILLILCVLAIIPTSLATSVIATPSIAASSPAIASETPQLSSSSSFVVPVLPPLPQPSSTAQVAPSSPEVQQVSSSSSFVVPVLPPLPQPSSTAQVAPSSPEVHQVSSSSSFVVPVLPPLPQPSSTAQVAPSSPEVQQVSSSSSVFVIPVLPPLTSVAPSTSPSPTRSSSTAPKPSSVAVVIYRSYASNQNECKNGGTYLVGPNNMKYCLCKDNYYGSTCEKECNALFKPLVYALAGTSGFLLLVICIALLMACKRKHEYDTGSHELDSFNNIGLRAKGKVNGSYGE